jgi:hypothetical protein
MESGINQNSNNENEWKILNEKRNIYTENNIEIDEQIDIFAAIIVESMLFENHSLKE